MHARIFIAIRVIISYSLTPLKVLTLWRAFCAAKAAFLV